MASRSGPEWIGFEVVPQAIKLYHQICTGSLPLSAFHPIAMPKVRWRRQTRDGSDEINHQGVDVVRDAIRKHWLKPFAKIDIQPDNKVAHSVGLKPEYLWYGITYQLVGTTKSGEEVNWWCSSEYHLTGDKFEWITEKV